MRHLFLIQTLLIAIIGAVHIAALKLYLYWLFPWLDVFVHFGGAMWVALAAMWLLSSVHQRLSFLKVFFIIVTVSVGWELFEAWGGIPREANFVFDTSLDLLMDVLGGIMGYLWGKHMLARDTMTTHGTA